MFLSGKGNLTDLSGQNISCSVSLLRMTIVLQDPYKM